MTAKPFTVMTKATKELAIVVRKLAKTGTLCANQPDGPGALGLV
jgi:hypothetical protein